MTAEEIITGARELDPGFTATRHPVRVALHALSRLQRRYVAELVKLDRRMIAEELEIQLPLEDFAAGYELETGESVPVSIEMTAIHRPLDLWAMGADKPCGLEPISWADRHRVRGRAVWIREGVLYFSGIEDDWSDVDKVVLTYTPTPEAITAVATELVLPLTAEDALTQGVGWFFAQRSKDAELARPRSEYRADAQLAEDRWLDSIRRRQGATVSRTREVW